MKCRIYSEEQTNIWCNTEYIDKKLFWKQIEVPRPIPEIPVSLTSFRDFYSELFSCQFNDSYTTDTYNVIVEELDRNISIYEIEKSIKHLKPGKAAGSDNVISELITNGGAVLKTTILELFNTLYDCGHFPEQWANGIIIPIYKKGQRCLPENYRGITLTSVMSKIFTSILNNRLCEWQERSAVASECQFAYKTGYSTTDAIFVLHGILSCTINKPSSDVYLAFIDLRKAFDTVNRDILYSKLMDIGISSKFLNIIIDMYRKMKCQVRTADGSSTSFSLNNGLMLGESLSPTLFSILINDIVDAMTKCCSMGVDINGVKVSVLKYADDIVLMATSPEGLQTGLDILKNYCEMNKLTVNITKSKVMCVSKRRKKAHQTVFMYDDKQLECVENFKYLGIEFNRLNNTNCAVEQLCKQAKRSKTVIDLHKLRHKSLSLQHILQLFDTLLKPILTYGSEVWGTANYDVIEKFYLTFIKQSLGVKSSTNTCMVFAETGRYPLSVAIKKSIIKYWLKVIQSEDKKLINIIYIKMKQSNCSWVSYVKEILYNTGFAEIWENQEVVNGARFVQLFEQRSMDMYMQSCHEDIQLSSRCRLYKELKDNHEMEPYLQRNINRALRITLTKLRLSSHKLLVERGRWLKPKIEYSNRLCTLCSKIDIQDEYHVLMVCPHYTILRKKYIKAYYYERPSMYKFIQLMKSDNKRDQFRLMVYANLLIKDFNNTM